MVNPYAPPVLDFSPLANLGDAFFNGRAQARKERYDEEAPKLLSQLYDASSGAPSATVPQTSPLAPLGQSAAAAYNPQGKEPTFAAMSGTQPSASLTGDKEAFARSIMPYALEASKQTGVDPRIIVAQAALESRWGKSAPGNNFFGIKSHGQGGGQTLATTEVVNGQPVRTNDSFRTYGGLGDSVAGYANFINSNPRYAGLKNAQGLDAQIAALQASGYATDPQYGAKISSIVKGLPAADLPAPGAQDAQFQIPGQVGMPAAQTGAAPQPISREMFNALAANPNTRAIAGQILSSRMNPQSQFDFQVVGDQLYRVSKRTGQVEAVPGVTKQQPGSFMNVNGRVLYNDPNARTSTDVTPGDMPAGARPMTAEERAAYQIPNDVGAFMGADGKPGVLSGRGTTVNVDAKGAGKFSEEANKLQAKRYSDIYSQADEARVLRGDVETLSTLLEGIGTGRNAEARLGLAQYAKAFGLDSVADALTGGKMGEMEAAQSILDKMTPRMRVPGSGATSDMEMRTFRNSLPSLMKQPGGNKIVADTFRGLFEYQAQAGDIAGQALRGEISQAEADKKLRELPGPFEQFKAFRNQNPALAAGTPRKLGEVKISGDAVRELKSMPDTPETRAQFDEIFGTGAADRILGKKQ